MEVKELLAVMWDLQYVMIKCKYYNKPNLKIEEHSTAIKLRKDSEYLDDTVAQVYYSAMDKNTIVILTELPDEENADPD